PGAFVHVFALDLVLLDDVAADGRADGHLRDRLAALEDLIDLVVVDAPEPQPVAGAALEVPVAAALGVEQVLHRDDQVGAVQVGQRFPFADGLPGDVDVELVDAAAPAHARRDAGEFAFVELHGADRLDRLGQALVADLPGLHAG